jgi:hypothetical protein
MKYLIITIVFVVCSCTQVSSQIRWQLDNCSDSLSFSRNYGLEVHVSSGFLLMNQLRIIPSLGSVISYGRSGKIKHFIGKFEGDKYCELVEFCLRNKIFEYKPNKGLLIKNESIYEYTETAIRVKGRIEFPYSFCLYNPYTDESIAFRYYVCDERISELIDLINACIPEKYGKDMYISKTNCIRW